MTSQWVIYLNLRGRREVETNPIDAGDQLFANNVSGQVNKLIVIPLRADSVSFIAVSCSAQSDI